MASHTNLYQSMQLRGAPRNHNGSQTVARKHGIGQARQLGTRVNHYRRRNFIRIRVSIGTCTGSHGNGKHADVATITFHQEARCIDRRVAANDRKQPTCQRGITPCTGPFVLAPPQASQCFTRDPVATASIVERNAAPASTMQNALSINERRDGASTGVNQIAFARCERGAIGNLNITDHPNAGFGRSERGDQHRHHVCTAATDAGHARHQPEDSPSWCLLGDHLRNSGKTRAHLGTTRIGVHTSTAEASLYATGEGA